MKILKIFGTLIFAFFLCPPAQAVDLNFNLLNINAPDQNKLTNTYANAYGFTPGQVAPAMMAPATEVPSILQIAKSAGSLPLSIWGLRKMGFSYMDILNMYLVPPTSLFNPSVPYDQFGSPLGQAWSSSQESRTTTFADPIIMQLSQIKLFTDYLKIPYTRILNLPTDPVGFTSLVINPWRPYPGFIPPGQAMKMGLWTPPGLAKKGYVGHPGHGKWKDDHDDDDHGHSKWKFESKGHGKGKGKWKD